MTSGFVPLIAMLLLFAATSTVGGQVLPGTTSTKNTGYKVGQDWAMDKDVTVTILAIENIKKLGRVIHVRVDNIPEQSCGGFHLARTVEHLAVTEKMMLKSNLVLSKENLDLPQSSLEAYRKWLGEKKGKREIVEIPLSAWIRSEMYLPGLMICNFLPSQT